MKTSAQAIPNIKLRQERLLRGWSQRDVAEQIAALDPTGDQAQAIAEYYVSRWERGIMVPRPYYCRKLCELFGKNAAELGLLQVQEESNVSNEGAASLPSDAPGSVEASPQAKQSESVSYRPQIDWGEAPNKGQFYGRDEELSVLKHWIDRDNARLIAILGMGGVGKTCLAATFVDQIKDSFDFVFWRSLQKVPSPQKFLQDCIQHLSLQQQTNLSMDVNEQISLLLKYLKMHRCLIVLDNVESVLQVVTYAGLYREEYKGYGELLQRIGETHHRSCLLLTSREIPREVSWLEGDGDSTRCYRLGGLGHSDGKNLLRARGLYGSETDRQTLVDVYAGNPLALKLVSLLILQVCNGDIANFLEEEKAVISDIAEVLEQQFARLSAQEKEILYWLAIEREAISLKALQENILHHPVTKRALQEALQSLQRRHLIETRNASFTLQKVVMEYTTDRFLESVYEEIKADKLALFQTHALMKAQAKDYVRASQMRLILAPLGQRLRTLFGKEGLEEKCKNILTRLRETSPQTSNYAAGNVLNLLLLLGYDLRGYDFSRLPILQAYLQGKLLPEVNFAYANLAYCVFTELFGSILSVAFSSDSELLAAGTANGAIHLWQVKSGETFFTYKGHKDWVRSIAFSPDGKIIASGSEDETIRLWDVNTGSCIKVLQGHIGLIFTVAFSPDGKFLASGGDNGEVLLWEISSERGPKTLYGHTGRVWSVAFSPDGKLLASGSEDQTIRFWKVRSGRCLKTLLGHSSWIYAVAFSADGKLLASGSEDQSVRVWEVSNGQRLQIWHEQTSRIWSVAFNPNGTLLASGGDDQVIRLWEVNSGRCLKSLQGHTNWIRSLTFSPDEKLLSSGSEDQSVRVWEVSSGQCLKTLQGHTNWIYTVAFSFDGMLLASGGDDQMIRVWEVSSGHCFKTLRGYRNRIWSVAFSPDGKLLASGGDDQMVYLWEVSSERCLKTLYGHTNRVRSVAFSPDGSIIGSGSNDQTVRLWEVSTGNLLNTLHEHTNVVYTIAFSPDGKLLASGGNDQVICLWEVNSWRCLGILRGHTSAVTSVAFSPDNGLLASGSEDHSVRLWETSNSNCIKTLSGHSSWVWSVSFSADGTRLASGGGDQTARVWEVSSGQCLKTLYEPVGWIFALAYGSDGNILATGNEKGAIKLWNVQTGQCIQILSSERPYEGMNITGLTGLSEAQKMILKELGAEARA
jgi:WD40 repeat protein/transcriptional regulator with XRE-family HTH domain